ncbi:hypothetical protein MBLNU459_g7054t1 [Dothideomycetes sp. NU459]
MPKTALLAGSRDPAADWYEAVTEIPIELVEAGDWVVVSPNTAIAVDGVVVRGDSSVLETNILKQQGINVGILTGASQKSADTIAQTLNISHEWVWADLLPHGKVKILEDVKKQYGHVCMVGDNVNDLAALSAASFSIFMSESTGPTAGAGADAILLPDPTSQELMRIPWLLQLTRATTQCMWQNIGWAVFYNVSAIALSSGILEFFHPILTLTPSGASLAMGLSSVVILVNSMRLENWHSTLLDYQMVHRTD